MFQTFHRYYYYKYHDRFVPFDHDGSIAMNEPVVVAAAALLLAVVDECVVVVDDEEWVFDVGDTWRA